MATLTAPHNYLIVYAAGQADVVCLFALRGVTTGDTADLSAWLQTINRGVVLGVSSFVEIAATWTGTVVTMPSGLAADDGYLLVVGSGA